MQFPLKHSNCWRNQEISYFLFDALAANHYGTWYLDWNALIHLNRLKNRKKLELLNYNQAFRKWILWVPQHFRISFITCWMWVIFIALDTNEGFCAPDTSCVTSRFGKIARWLPPIYGLDYFKLYCSLCSDIKIHDPNNQFFMRNMTFDYRSIFFSLHLSSKNPQKDSSDAKTQSTYL